MFKVVKAGKLANGAERGKGSIIHYSEYDYIGPSLCGVSPKISWSLRENKEVTCKKCLKLFNQKFNLPKEIKCQQCHKTPNETDFKNIYWVPYNEHGLKYEGWIIWCRPCQKIFEDSLLHIGKMFGG